VKKDFFAIKAKNYDSQQRRIDNVNNVANAIKKSISLQKDMHILDFGSGTGLLLERIAPYVGKITAVDKSPSMNAKLRAKMPNIECKVELLELDLTKDNINTKFDGIISSLTIHHIKDIKALFTKFYSMLKDGGFIALADLDKEDGTFESFL